MKKEEEKPTLKSCDLTGCSRGIISLTNKNTGKSATFLCPNEKCSASRVLRVVGKWRVVPDYKLWVSEYSINRTLLWNKDRVEAGKMPIKDAKSYFDNYMRVEG